MAFPSILRFTRPRTFLYVMSLRTGTELIVLTLLINKLTGVYGILALLTGLHLSPMQLSMYIYSILALLLTAWLAPQVRKQTPLQCLGLAWFYVFDSIINALYTVAFGVGWFMVLAQHHAGVSKTGPGASTIDDTAGFTDPEHTVSRVVVIPTSSPNGGGANIARDIQGGSAHTPSVSGVLGNTILHSGSIASITVISALWAVRVYFILVIMAYARGVLRQHIMLHPPSTASAATPAQLDAVSTTTSAAAAGPSPSTARNSTSDPAGAAGGTSTDLKPVVSASSTLDPPSSSHRHHHHHNHALISPFTPPGPLSAGWPGKLGRAFVAVFPSYWLGAPADGEEAAAFSVGMAAGAGRSRKGGDAGTPGVFERERRRRAGTGPPMLKPIELGRVSK